MAVSANVHVDITDIGVMSIGCSDHFLVWVESATNSKKGKPVIRRWHLDRFGDDEVMLMYQNGEVHGFAESIKRKVDGGMIEGVGKHRK